MNMHNDLSLIIFGLLWRPYDDIRQYFIINIQYAKGNLPRNFIFYFFTHFDVPVLINPKHIVFVLCVCCQL